MQLESSYQYSSFFVVQPPAIDTEPQDATVSLGDSTLFSVVASGEFLIYQWLFNGAQIVDNNRIQGSNTANLSISEVTIVDLGDYRVRVSNDAGFIDSDTVSLVQLSKLGTCFVLEDHYALVIKQKLLAGMIMY